MATIEERSTNDGRTVYRVKIRLKGHPSTSATFDRKTDAKKWIQQTESAIRQNRHFQIVEAKRHTVGETIDRYMRDVLPQKRSQRDQKRQLQWWKDQIGSYTLADATAPIIAEKREQLAAGKTRTGGPRSPGTVNRYLAALSHVFSMAVREWHWLESNPLMRVRKPKEPRGRVRFLSEDERNRLLTACKKSGCALLYPLVVLALSTGARKGEILGLTWSNVDFKRGVIRLEQTKNDDRRALPLTGLALKELQRLSKIRRIDTDFVFPSSKTQNRHFTIDKPWQKALEEAEIEDFRFHDLRHSAASYLAMNGATLGEIAEILGHRTLQMVKRYAHISEQHTAKIVARMNESLFGSEH